MKIAITGANGFVGHTLVNHFSNIGHEVFALIRPNASIPPGKYQIQAVDYADTSALSRLLADVDVLIHNAGKTTALHHSEMLGANVGLTQKLVTTVNAIPRPIHFIYISSQAASRESQDLKPVSEEQSPQPLTIYGKSKAWAERVVRRDCRQPYSILRPCPVYGAGDRDFLSLFKLVQRGFRFQIGSTDRYINMIHVSQLAEFIGLVANNPVAFGECFFATDNQIYTQAGLAAEIANASGKLSLKLTLPEFAVRGVFTVADAFGRLSGRLSAINKEKMTEILAKAWLADPAKAKTLLGWDPVPRLPELIEETYQWYIDAGWL